MQRYSIVIHGGAGTLIRSRMSPEKEKNYKKTLNDVSKRGFDMLAAGESALDTVEAAVKMLEDSPLFNAGKGSVFTHGGKHEMEASIMDGRDLRAGAVAVVAGIKNPVSLARDVMEKSGHVFLSGEGAMQFAEELGHSAEPPEYFYDEYRHRQWLEIKDTDRSQLDHSPEDSRELGTVGAVACDRSGHVAAATSTGGMTNKRWGRIGDSSLIGSGNYANDRTCAVSCTGTGEYFIRGVIAYDVSCLMEYKGMSLTEAVHEVIHQKLPDLGGSGGLIATDARGNIALSFNTEGMYRAYRISDPTPAFPQTRSVAIYRE